MNAKTDENDDVELLGDESVPEEEHQRFDLSSYGWDSDVEGLVKRMDRGDIYTPGFQRRFVWSNPEKSRFIESLILGLPVPTIFLAQDSESKKLNIVDGQQRLRSLQEYLNGAFALSGKAIESDLRGRYFSREVAKAKTSKVLTDSDARALADSILHSVVIRPDPTDNDVEKGNEYNRAVIQVFQRLNTSGKPLQAHEVRTSIFHGPFDALLRRLNQNDSWRSMFGKEHSRLKDMEAILRAIALWDNGEQYSSPMPRFLDRYMEEHRNVSPERATKIESLFNRAIETAKGCFGTDFFKNKTTFVLSRFDCWLVALMEAVENDAVPSNTELKKRMSLLEADKKYVWATEEFVNDTDRVTTRLSRAKLILIG